MQQRTRKTLQGQGGFAMILVLCLGALFLALSAAMIYAAGVLTANANRQLQEQELYERAASFSKVLEEELLSGNGSFADFVGKTYVTSKYLPDSEHTFELAAGNTTEVEAEGIKIILKKRVDNENLNTTTKSATYKESITYQDDVSFKNLLNADKDGLEIYDYIIDVSVTVEDENETYTYTQSYRHKGKYTVTYTFGSNTDKYTWTGSALENSVGETKDLDTIYLDTTIVRYCNMNNPLSYTFEKE